MLLVALQLPALLLQSPPLPRGAELWHEGPPSPAISLGMQLGAPGMYCLPSELAALLEANPLWPAPASSGRDAPPALQEDLRLLDRLPAPHPGSAAQVVMALQAVVIAVMGKGKLKHSWGGHSLPPPLQTRTGLSKVIRKTEKLELTYTLSQGSQGIS